MEIRRFRSKSSDIKTLEQLENYHDLELFCAFDEFDDFADPVPFIETAVAQSAIGCLFRVNEIFPVHVLSNKDEFVSVARNSFECVPIDIANVPIQTDLGMYYFRERRMGINHSEPIGHSNESVFGIDRPYVSIQRMFGYGVQRGRSITAIHRIARYWQFVKFVENAYTNPSKFVRSVSRVPSFESLFPGLSFDLYKDRGLMEHYPFLHSREIGAYVSQLLREQNLGEKERMAVKETVIEKVVDYIEGLKESYLGDIILPFSRLPDAIAEQVLTFIHDECDDCFVTVKISERGISLYRGVDRKMVPYFEEMFEQEDDKTLISIFK